MSIPTRLATRLRPLRPLALRATRSFVAKPSTKADGEWPQRTPLGSYYENIIVNPSPYPFTEKPEEPPSSAEPEVPPREKKPEPVEAPRPTKKKPGRPRKNPTTTTTTAGASTVPALNTSSPPLPSPPPQTAEEKARVVFGTRLAGPEDRDAHAATKKSQSTYIGGVLVPPQPEEPDNCCMSGCVNCVWDLFREDMEEWTAKKAEAERKAVQAAAVSVDADGGGSEANWAPPGGVKVGDAKIAKDLWDDDLFGNVPVGIREFMKQEKRLKERHEREGKSGG